MGFYGNIIMERNTKNKIVISLIKNGVLVDISMSADSINILESVLLEENNYPKSNKRLNLKNNKSEVEILVRNRSVGGGKAGQMYNHDASIKIESPKKYENTTIKIPKDKNVTTLPSNIKGVEIDLAKEFVIDNTTDLRAIFYSDDDKHVFNSYKHMIRKNIDIIKDIKCDSDPKLKEYFDKLK